MKIKFKTPDLGRIFCDYYCNEQNHKIGVENMIDGFNKYMEYAEQIHYLIKNRQSLTNEEFIERLNSYCCFDLNYKDMLKILSNMTGKNFIKDEEIRTTMVDSRDLGYMTEYYCYDMHIACTENANIKSLEFYSIEQLNKLINLGEIVVLDVFKTTKSWLDELDEQHRVENPIHFDVPFNHRRCCMPKFPIAELDLDYYLTDMNDEFKVEFYKYIRKNLKNKHLIDCLKKYLEEFNYYLKDCIIIRNSSFCSVEEEGKFAEMCKSEFDEKGCIERLKQLSLI